MTLVRHKYNAHEVSDEERAATFAARQAVLKSILQRLEDHGGTSFLLTGSRGTGKSTLVHLVRQKINETPALSQVWLPVVLPEEQIGVSSLRDLLVVILEQLAADGIAIAGQFHEKCEQEMDEEISEELAIQGIAAVANETGKTLLVGLENLDQLFTRALSDERMQSTLRRLLMHEKHMCLLATSVSQLTDLQDYDQPFYEYFEHFDLERLNDQQADEVLSRRAKYENNDLFLSRYQQSRGVVRAINRLTGGNPRLLVMLYEVVSMGDVESAVAVLRQLLDELTPLYDGLLLRLSNQHRKIVDAIMRNSGQATVGEIASTARLADNNVRAQLKRLKDTGCVAVVGGGKGKEAVYTIEDRLFSTWYQLRYFRPQRRRIEIFIEVLRAWFTAEERQQQLDELLGDIENTQPELGSFLVASLEGTEFYENARETWESFFTKETQQHEVNDEFRSYDELVSDETSTPFELAEFLSKQAEQHYDAGQYLDAINDLTRIIELAEAPQNVFAEALYNRGVIHGKTGENQRAIDDHTRVVELPDAPTEVVVRALYDRGTRYEDMGDHTQAIVDYTCILKLPDAPLNLVADALFGRGASYGHIGDATNALADYTRVADMPDAPADHVAKALINRGLKYYDLGEVQRAISDFTSVVEQSNAPRNFVAIALLNRAARYGEIGNSQRAIVDYTRIVDVADAPIELVALALIGRGFTYGEMGDSSKEIADNKHVTQMAAVSVSLFAKGFIERGNQYVELGDSQRAIADYTRVISRPDASVDHIAIALINRGHMFTLMGKQEQATLDAQRVSEMIGASGEARSTGAVNAGTALAHLNRVEAALHSYLAAVHDFEIDNDHRRRVAADIILESSHNEILAANPDFVQQALELGIEAFGVKTGSDAVELLQSLAKPEMKHRWSDVFRHLMNVIPEEERQSLEMLAPVAAMLDGAEASSMNRLAPEQRDFMNEILRRFEST